MEVKLEKEEQMPTLRDIAKLSGTSLATVSRVLNGQRTVNPELAAKVLKVASELGYEKQRGKHEKQTIAVLVTWPSISPSQSQRDSQYAMMYLHSIYVTAEKLGYHLVFHFGTQEGSINPFLQWQISTKQFEGALIVGSYFDMEKTYIHHLQHANIPFFRLTKPPTNFHTLHSYVAVDDYQGGYKATSHLLSMGITNILHLAGPQTSRDALERKEGFLKACEDHGLSKNQISIFQGNFHELCGEACGEKLAKEGNLPDGIFAANDMMAIGCMRALKKRGIKIPDDVRLIGFDDIMLASYVEPGLSTIRVPFDDLAQMATEELVKQIEFPVRKNTRVLLEGELLIRDSCGYKSR